jgi:hypothetical protein
VSWTAVIGAIATSSWSWSPFVPFAPSTPTTWKLALPKRTVAPSGF